MAAEIAEQPVVFRRLLSSYKSQFLDVRALIEERKPRMVLLAARGTSDHAALYAKYLVEVQWGVPAGLVSPSTYTIYGSRPDLGDVLFITFSQSGVSPDLLEATEVARAGGALTVAVTNDILSPLARAAEAHVEMLAGREKAIAATKTYTAELLAAYLLLAPEPGDLRMLPELAHQAVRSAEILYDAVRITRVARSIVTVARGYSYATAREAALKLMETSYLPAQAFSGADLLHGPIAMLDRQVAVIAIRSPGAVGRALDPVITAARDHGARVWTIGAKADLGVASGELPDAIRPILEIIPLQQLARLTAVSRGLDPDHPRGLTKVTKTF